MNLFSKIVHNFNICTTCFHIKLYTVYTIYLANNKFGELGCNAYWWTLQVGKQGDTECTLFVIHMIIGSVGVH